MVHSSTGAVMGTTRMRQFACFSRRTIFFLHPASIRFTVARGFDGSKRIVVVVEQTSSARFRPTIPPHESIFSLRMCIGVPSVQTTPFMAPLSRRCRTSALVSI